MGSKQDEGNSGQNNITVVTVKEEEPEKSDMSLPSIGENTDGMKCEKRTGSIVKAGFSNEAFVRDDEAQHGNGPPRLKRSVTVDLSSIKRSWRGNNTRSKLRIIDHGLTDSAFKEIYKINIPTDNDDDEKILKEGNNRFRWNLVFNFLLLIIVPLPLWLPFASLETSFILLPMLQIIFMGCWLTVTVFSWISFIKLWMSKDKMFQDRVNSNEHLIVISAYKEPATLLISTIESIEIQEQAKYDINLNISLEERTPQLDEKIAAFEKRFSKSFKRLFFTIHPYNLPGEIPGKCSNANYGIRKSMNRLELLGVDTDNLIITTCDADTKFHPQFFNALTDKFQKTKNPHESVFQSPLLYNWKLDEANVVTRVTGIMRATLMMGAMIPFNINTMSIFSFSGKLCKAGNFIHPSYQMDDIIALIRWMGVVGDRLNIVMVPVPTLSGPTSGRVVEEEMVEWAVQARRWTIGAGEVFHYFMVKSRRIPFLTAISWGVAFLFYYGILLCCSHLYGVTLGLSFYFFLPKDATFYGSSFPIKYIIVHASLVLLYLNSISMFVLDRLSQQLLVPRPEERISVVRNLYHVLVSPLVIIGYSLVEFWAIMELAVRGKQVCQHKPSKKAEL